MPGVSDDEMPELTPAKRRTGRSFSELLEARGIRRPGRPPSSNPKLRITIRLDADVVEHFKDKGAGWQTRLNEALIEVVEAERQAGRQPRSRAAAASAKPDAAKAKPAAKTIAAKKPAKTAPVPKAPARKAAPSGAVRSRRGKLIA